MRDPNYLVLIGSQARGDSDERSDVDVLSVGRPPDHELESLHNRTSATVNVVSFEPNDFVRLYSSGSLFLHHCFQEGKLISGDQARWDSLKSRFQVQSRFDSEIERCAAVCRLISKVEIFGNHFLAPFTASYTQVKNASIFFLAHRQIYCFNKNMAIAKTAELLRFQEADLLIGLRSMYDYSVRGLDVDLPFPVDRTDFGVPILRTATDFVQRIQYACC